MAALNEGSPEGLSAHARILLGGFVALFFLNILNSAYSTVLSIIKDELALSYTLSGSLMSSYFAGYTLGQIPWGFLADRAGSRWAMTLSIIGIASSTVLFGLASNIWLAIASRFLAGLLGAGVFVPSVRLVSGWFSPWKRGTALGVLSVGGSIGLIVASWTVPLITLHLGWRASMITFGILGVLSSTVIWTTLRDRRAGGSSDRPRMGLAGLLRSGSFWILALTQFLRLGANYTFIGWLPLLLQEEHGFDLILAGAAFSVFNFSGMLSNPVGGFISDRVGEGRVLMVSFLVLAMDVILFTSAKASLTVFFAAFILGWFINFIRSPPFAILPKLYGVDAAGRVSGIHNTFASLGALALPLLLGYVRDATLSYHAGWMALSALMLMGALINFFLRHPSEK